MNPPHGFTLTRQDKPANCGAVAMRNATEWIRLTAPTRVAGRMMTMSVEDWEAALGTCDRAQGTHYYMSSWWIAGTFPLDVMHITSEVHAYGNVEPRLRSLLRAGWVLVVGIDSDYRAGARHAIAVVPPAFTLLDGKRDAPYRWNFAELAQHDPAFILALRANRDLHPLVGEKV